MTENTHTHTHTHTHFSRNRHDTLCGGRFQWGKGIVVGASCSQRGTGDHHCYWSEGQEGPSRRATHQGWPALEAAVGQREEGYINIGIDRG